MSRPRRAFLAVWTLAIAGTASAFVVHLALRGRSQARATLAGRLKSDRPEYDLLLQIGGQTGRFPDPAVEGLVGPDAEERRDREVLVRSGVGLLVAEDEVVVPPQRGAADQVAPERPRLGQHDPGGEQAAQGVPEQGGVAGSGPVVPPDPGLQLVA